jgi:hypothetical protein
MIYIEHPRYDFERFTNQCHVYCLVLGPFIKSRKERVRIVVRHVMNPETMDEEFMSLVEYIKYKLFE